MYSDFVRKQINKKPREKLEFMIREWHSEDTINYESEESDSEEENENDNGLYNIYVFGCTDKGESVCLKIKEFTPYFYVKIPDDWSQNQANSLARQVKNSLWKKKDNLVSWKIFKRKDAYGFNNLRNFKFIRFVFNNLAAYRSAQWIFKKPIRGYENKKFPLYETSIDPMLVFIHLRNIQASGWVTIDSKKLNCEDFSRCQYNFSCNWKSIDPLDKSSIPPFVTMSFDLECFSHNGYFPDPIHPDNYITQIGSAFQSFGSEENILKTVIVVGECDPIEGVHLISCKTEKELIKNWIKLIQEMDPDQLIGYNIDNFDWNYIWERAQHCDLEDFICENLPRLYHVRSEYKKDKLESNAYGFNSFNFITTPGIGQMDLLHWFRKNAKLDKYTLDFVSEKYLGEKKRDVSPQQIFKWSGPNAKSKERTIVADYCAQDTTLPLRLMENRCMFPNLVEMSRVTYVPFTWLITRGEQVKAYSQLNRELRKLKFVLPSKIPGSHEDFIGATVLNCERGFHSEPVSGLDFASLYPSIMIAWNMCPTTWVSREKYNNIEGVDYKGFETDDGTHTFVQSVKGVVPSVLDKLWKERKVVKRQMKNEKDPRMVAILNGKQLAIKVSMNSIYGFFGVKQGVLPCRAIAASVTYTGRQMIKHSKECAETWYDGSPESGGVKARVIYGDSVSRDTPITIKHPDGKIDVLEIQEFADTYNPFPQFKTYERGLSEKQQCDLTHNNYRIMTSSGWKIVRRVIRHKCRKKMYRITTERGVVTVTEDHSLLNPSGMMLKPEQLQLGTSLMCKPFNE